MSNQRSKRHDFPGNEKAPPVQIAAARGAHADLQDLPDQRVRHGFFFSRRIERVVLIISNRWLVLAASSAIANLPNGYSARRAVSCLAALILLRRA
jgi:hypothetical protein